METKIEIEFDGLKFLFVTDRSLFSPNQLDAGSRLLLESIKVDRSIKTVMDLGCGWGAMGIILAKLFPASFVYLVDNDPVAISVSEENIKINGIKNARTFKADITWQTVPKKFDLIFTNPPWSKNKSVIPGLVKFSYADLILGGKFSLVINQKYRTEELLENIFGNVKVISEKPPYKVLQGVKNP